MTFRVLLFAALRDSAGCNEIVVEVTPSSDSASAGEILDAIAESVPQAAELIPSCRLAVNHSYVGPDTVVLPTDDLAVIPPTSGG